MFDRDSPVRRLVHTVIVVTGALVIGQALHESLVLGQRGLLAGRTLLGLGGGTIAVGIAYYIRPTPRSFGLGDESDTPERDGGDGSFDPDVSPVGEQLETVEGADRSDENV